jgi:hypothetical protein
MLCPKGVQYSEASGITRLYMSGSQPKTSRLLEDEEQTESDFIYPPALPHRQYIMAACNVKQPVCALNIETTPSKQILL